MYLLDSNILIYLLRGAEKENFTYEEICGYLDVFQASL